MKRIRLTRFNKEVDGELLWQTYQDDDFCEFFRRIPPSWTREDAINFEAHTQSQLYTILWDEWPVGFAVVTAVCPYSLTCQVGALLFKDYRDKIVDGFKIAFWSIFRLAEMLFNKTTIQKMSMRFLTSRQDLVKGCERSGFRKEGEFKNSAFCYGKLQDEYEYALDKEAFNSISEGV